MKVPLSKVSMSAREMRAACEVITSGWLAQGPKVAELEEKFAEYIGCEECVAVSSATAGLHLSLIVSKAIPGDGVICPSYTFIATPNSIRMAGMVPLFYDITPRSDNMKSPFSKTVPLPSPISAIMPVYQGHSGGSLSIFEFAEIHDLEVIEDAAPALGACYDDGTKVGSRGNLCVFSFYASKVITCGEGGLIALNDSDVAARLRRLRSHGMSVPNRERHDSKDAIFETYDELGYNYKMTDIQAAIALAQLVELDNYIERRQLWASKYDEAFSQVEWLQLPYKKGNIYSTYKLLLKPEAPIERNVMLRRLREAGVGAKRGFLSCHREKVYKDMYPDPSLPATEYATDNTIWLPMYPSMSQADVAFVIDEVLKICED